MEPRLMRRSLTIVVALAVAPGGGCGDSNRSERRAQAGCEASAFDRARWRELQRDDGRTHALDGERAALARKVVRCRLLDGFDRAGVRRLLGPPTASGKRYMEYFISPDGLDQNWLFIDIVDGRVDTYEVGQG